VTSRSRSFAPIIAAVLLLFPVLYVGSYLALVVPEGRRVTGTHSYSVRIHWYRLNDKRLEQIFWPLEQFDRRLRPGAWDSPRGVFRIDRGGGPVEKERIKP